MHLLNDESMVILQDGSIVEIQISLDELYQETIRQVHQTRPLTPLRLPSTESVSQFLSQRS